ncbi:MAG: alpha-L-fucosidase [Bacteroidales bacterium]
MRAVIAAVLVVAASVAASSRTTPGQAKASPYNPDGAAAQLARPSAQQLAWHDLELGMFVHFAPQTWQDSETDRMTTEPSAMNPERLDTEQWVRVAESMGARYIVFVAKHEGGFCWWQTDTTDFGVKNTPWRGGKGDLLKDLAESCRKRGMRLGVYLSPQDRKHAVGVGGRAKDPAYQAAYEKLFRQQLTEVLSRYGDMTEVWFDGSLVFDVGDILARHAPNAVVFQGPQASIRWVGNEDGVAPYPAWNAVTFPKAGKKWGDYTAADGDPSGNRWLPNECDARIRATWFWHTDNANTLKSVNQLMEMYYRSVGHGAVLLLNQTPDRTGLIPESDAARAKEFGAEIRRRLGGPVAETTGKGSETVMRLPGTSAIDHVVTMEDIREGERVRSYVVDGLVDGRWQQLAAGTAIGHKKIDRLAAPVNAAQVRLRVTEATDTPLIRSFAVFGPGGSAR